MSTTQEQEEFVAKLRHMNEETAKFIAEERKLNAEARKYRFDPFYLIVGAIVAGIVARLPEILHALNLGH